MGKKNAKSQVDPAAKRDLLSFLGNCRRTPYLVFIVALVPRILHLLAIADSPTSAHPIGDGESYHLWAQQLAQGDWLGSGVFYAAPLYPYFMGILYALFGPVPMAVLIAQVLLGSFACVLVSRAGARFFDERSGALAGLLLAVYPVAIYFDGLIQKTTLDLVLFSGLLYLVAVLKTSGRKRFWAMTGLALGLLSITRENAVIFLPILLLWLFLKSGAETRAQKIGQGLAYLVGFALVIMPVTLRNGLVAHEWVLTTSNLGTNFYIGNHRGANGRYEPLRWGRDDWKFEREDATALAEQETGTTLNPAQVSRFWLHKTLGQIAEAPLPWLGLLLRKTLLVLNATEIGDTESVYGTAALSPLLALLMQLFHFGVLFPLALAGAWLNRARLREQLPLYLLFASYAFSVVLFFVFDRFRFPLVAILAAFAASALLRVREWLPRSPRTAGTLVALLLGAVIAHLGLIDRSEFRANSGFNHAKILVGQGRFQESLKPFAEALASTPNRVELRVAYANALINLGRFDEARTQLNAALSLKSDYGEALSQMGLICLLGGKDAEALKYYDQALPLLPEDGTLHNNLAWILATSPDPAIQDGARAVQLAERACKLQGEDADNLDTLAASYARAGRFDEAVTTLTRAIELAGTRGRPKDLAEKQARLADYRTQRPFQH